jgi:hypothetical protein
MHILDLVLTHNILIHNVKLSSFKRSAGCFRIREALLNPDIAKRALLVQLTRSPEPLTTRKR